MQLCFEQFLYFAAPTKKYMLILLIETQEGGIKYAHSR